MLNIVPTYESRGSEVNELRMRMKSVGVKGDAGG